MKTPITTSVLVAATVAILITGCSALYDRGEQVTQLPDGSTTTNETYTVTEEVKTVADTAKMANQYFNPTPSAPIVNWAIDGALVALAGFGGWWGRLQSRKRREAQQDAITARLVAESTVDAIEYGAETLETLAQTGGAPLKELSEQLGRIKKRAQQVSTRNGVSDVLHEIVKERTQ